MSTLFSSEQFANPYHVAALVLVTGGGLVSRSIARVAGVRFTPVCFSLGWTAYSLQVLADISNHGRLLPSPDEMVKVFNLDTGSIRINRSWTIDRLMRDLTLQASREYPMSGDGMRILVYEAVGRSHLGATTLPYGWIHWIMGGTMLLQIGLAVIPLTKPERDWAVMLVTVVGVVSGSIFSSLPQWAAEKLPHNQASEKTFALTAGIGSGDIIVIKGKGWCLDLEELSATRSPLSWSLWDVSQMVPPRNPKPQGQVSTSKRSWSTLSQPGKVTSWGLTHWWGGPLTVWGRTLSIWITTCVAILHAATWLFILAVVVCLKSHAWYLILIAGVGTIANIIIASVELPPHTHNTPLKFQGRLITQDVPDGLMDGLMDLKEVYECDASKLLPEFFPGKLALDVKQWWGLNGMQRNTKPYANRRARESLTRPLPNAPDMGPGPRQTSLHKVPMRASDGVEVGASSSSPFQHPDDDNDYQIPYIAPASRTNSARASPPLPPSVAAFRRPTHSGSFGGPRETSLPTKEGSGSQASVRFPMTPASTMDIEAHPEPGMRSPSSIRSPLSRR